MPGRTWFQQVKEILEELEIESTMEEIEATTKARWKKIVMMRVWKKEQEEYYKWSSNSTKCKLMENDKIEMKKYIKEMQPEEAKIIMEIRLGMVDVKTNYKKKYDDTTCRQCGKEEETAEHFLKCLTPPNQKHKLKDFNEIWSLKNIEKIKIVANHTLSIIKNNPHFEYKG